MHSRDSFHLLNHQVKFDLINKRHVLGVNGMLIDTLVV